MLCSIDANRGDYQNGWDTDQFPMDIYELAQAWLVILEGGGLTTGGTNFDAKTRRNSTDWRISSSLISVVWTLRPCLDDRRRYP